MLVGPAETDSFSVGPADSLVGVLGGGVLGGGVLGVGLLAGDDEPVPPPDSGGVDVRGDPESPPDGDPPPGDEGPDDPLDGGGDVVSGAVLDSPGPVLDSPGFPGTLLDSPGPVVAPPEPGGVVRLSPLSSGGVCTNSVTAAPHSRMLPSVGRDAMTRASSAGRESPS